MVRPTLLISNLFVVLFLLSCSKEKIDTEQLDRYSNDLFQWISAPSDSTVLFVDSNGIEETISVGRYYEHIIDVIHIDDYDNSYGTFSKEIKYVSSISDIRLSVSSNGYSYGEDSGFKLRFNYKANDIMDYKVAVYDFDQPHLSANCERLDSLRIGEQMYKDLMHVNFDNLIKGSDIRSFYYSKDFGLVGFVTNAGVLSSIK